MPKKTTDHITENGLGGYVTLTDLKKKTEIVIGKNKDSIDDDTTYSHKSHNVPVPYLTIRRTLAIFEFPKFIRRPLKNKLRGTHLSGIIFS